MCLISIIDITYYPRPALPRHASRPRPHIAALLNLKKDICLLYPLHTYPFSLSMFLNIFVILCRSQIRTLSKMEMKPRAQSGAARAAKLGDTRRKWWQLLWLQTSTTSTIKCEIYYCLYLYLITISIQSKSVPLLVFPPEIHIQKSHPIHGHWTDSNKIGARRAGPSAKCIF